MEVKIGMQMAPRELVVETAISAKEIETALAAALESDGLFVLTDEKGGTVLVPASKIAFVELGRTEPRRIGFGGT